MWYNVSARGRTLSHYRLADYCHFFCEGGKAMFFYALLGTGVIMVILMIMAFFNGRGKGG